MNIKSLVFIFSIIFYFFYDALGQQIISVSDYGIKPNTFIDATPMVKMAIEACKSENGTLLVFPKGRYDFWPAAAETRNYFISNTSSEQECPSKLKTIGLLFEKKKSLTIEGNGSLFVFHGKMIIFTFDGCQNIRLRNIEMDFERPTMSEMTFRNVSDSEIVITVNPDSKYAIIDGRIKWYGEGWSIERFLAILVKPDEGTEFSSSWTPFQKAKAFAISPSTVSFKGDFKKYNFQPGEVLTVRDPYRDQVGAFINRSENIHLRNVSMHYMHGLGIVSQFSENLVFDSVFVVPRPESGRVIAAFADCMHFSGCKGQILIENCRFSGSHDDPVNIHGTHLKVTEIISPNTLKVRFMHPQTYGFEAFFKGDTVAFLHSSKLQIFGSGIVKSAKLISEREMLIELADRVTKELVISDCLENTTWTPSVTIRNCRFERTNTRGLLVTTRRKVLIENNEFINTGMHAILIADDASSWYESGPVQDVTIRNNIFENCGYNSVPRNYVIAVAPENHELVPGYMVHKNIQIENNIFKVYDYPVLTARSTENLVFSGNTIIRTNFMRPYGDTRPQFNFNGCRKIVVKNNRFEGFSELEIRAENMSKNDISGDIKNITVVK